MKDSYCLSLRELQFARPNRGILEEPTKVHVRERVNCKHLLGPGVKSKLYIVTDIIVFPIPLTPARTYSAGKGQKKPGPVFLGQMTDL